METLENIEIKGKTGADFLSGCFVGRKYICIFTSDFSSKTTTTVPYASTIHQETALTRISLFNHISKDKVTMKTLVKLVLE